MKKLTPKYTKTFPYCIIFNNNKRISCFQCEEHMNKAIKKENLNINNYKIQIFSNA